MNDYDDLIERATATFGEGPTRFQMGKKYLTLAVFDLSDARTVAERAYRRGYESASLAHGNSDAIVRREMAREALDRLKRQWNGESGYNSGTFGDWLRGLAEEGE